MISRKLYLPENYTSALSLNETQKAITVVKDAFQKHLSAELNLARVSAPLFVRPETGLNDDLSGVERPVDFDLLDTGYDVQIVQSLAKWKRQALANYGFEVGEGLYTDMNAIRRDEELDNLHSVYVDQWDWEKIISEDQRTIAHLEETVRKIVKALCDTQAELIAAYPVLKPFISPQPFFITSEDLLRMYPGLSPKEREDAVCKEHGTVFIIGIGDTLSDGEPHDLRAPDYDDWALNGDILIWYPVLGRSVELSSMGIRVDQESLRSQLIKSDCEYRTELAYHKNLLSGKLPLTIGGGIGQSRICMVLLNKAHIGEIQCSCWSDEMITRCEEKGIHLL